MSAPALSFVVPLYNSESTIAVVVADLTALNVAGGHEIILVDDGSRDGTVARCLQLIETATVPLTLVRHARNFGEHNAVLSGWRQARGAYIVNLDDDGQNPPAEGLRLWRAAQEKGWDVVFGHYAEKKHSAWRNAGSWVTNRMTDLALEKPRGFYLSSFRCVSGFVAREVTRNSGPFPYIDGLILQVTQKIGSIEVRHAERQAGQSGYTLRRLLRLWLSAWVNFSVLPLRIATVCGLGLAGVGVLGFAVVLYLRATNRGPAYGWGSMMAALVVFSGMQLVLLGLIGEYIGRMFMTINQRPQAVVREIIRSQT